MELQCDASGFETVVETLVPVRLLESKGVDAPENLLLPKRPCVSFRTDRCVAFSGKGSFVLLDFGRELCGSVRLIVRSAPEGGAKFRIVLGESVSEACSAIGEKNATNDHSPRDFIVQVSSMSDMLYGLSGFRFAKIELTEDCPVLMQSAFAVSRLPHFAQEARFTSSDELLNRIFETAAYTLKLNCQNGVIWDGIKRDRLVWSGDLHQEIVTSVYLFGKTVHAPHSLEFLRECTPDGQWMNGIPNYSAWWVLSLCDYCSMTGDDVFFRKHHDHAESILAQLNACIADDGVIDYHTGTMAFFLDWPTYAMPDAVHGTEALLCCTAERLLRVSDSAAAREILRKLRPRLYAKAERKQTLAFQVLAGRRAEGDLAFLEKDGAAGFSTFMAYYLLKAMAQLGGGKMLPILKSYFGGMLARGATTFWEDFDLAWLEGSGRIDRLPEGDERDLHGDYGAFCYTGLRHSLCHGWSSGVAAFIIEHVLGLELLDGYRRIRVQPHPLGVQKLHAQLPTPYGSLRIDVAGGVPAVEAPSEILVERA